MEIRIAQESLSTLLSRAQSVIERKSTRAILENVLLEAGEGVLRISATDLRISLVQESPCTVQRRGSAAIPGRKFHEIVREMPKGEITVNLKDNQWVTVALGKATFHLPASPSEEYPTIPPAPSKFLSFSSSAFRKMIEKTIFSASNDESRIYLTGVFLTEWKDNAGNTFLRMVATDGHRMSLIDKNIEKEIGIFESGIIIPKKGLSELRNILELSGDTFEIACSEGKLHSKVGSIVLSVTLIDSAFPNYEQVIPKDVHSWIRVNRVDLSNALRRVSLLSDEETKTVLVEVEKESMLLSSDSPRFGDAREEMAVEYSGNPLKVAFNASYFVELLRAMEGGEVRLGVSDALAPCIVQGVEDSGYVSVIMPMRLD